MKEEIVKELMNIGSRKVTIHYKDGTVITGLHNSSHHPDYLQLQITVLEKTQYPFHVVNFTNIEYVVLEANGQEPRVVK